MTLICRIHGQRMRDVEVPIAYGQDAIDHGYKAARTARFPNSRDTVSGGCLTYAGVPKTKMVPVCAGCDLARWSWLNRSPATK